MDKTNSSSNNETTTTSATMNEMSQEQSMSDESFSNAGKMCAAFWGRDSCKAFLFTLFGFSIGMLGLQFGLANLVCVLVIVLLLCKVYDGFMTKRTTPMIKTTPFKFNKS